MQSWAGGPQIANPQICGLTKSVIFADLPQVWQFADLRFADLPTQFFEDLKLPQILYFSLYIYIVKTF
jgi:hypothetical protein